ncbi:retrotransposon protein, putative, ty1-copia subclass [Tanacetum coccineum]
MLFTMRETYVDRNPKSHIVLGIVPVTIIDRQLPFEYTITSRSTAVVVMALPAQNINHLAFRSMFEREKLSGNNFNDWTLNTFKVFKNKVENQLGKIIKALRSDRGDEYISQEFKDYLKACGIVQHLTPSYTPQHNGVFDRRNCTLLDMVRSIMNLTPNLAVILLGYTLESATTLFNMVPTKKVDKTPYELWYGKVPNLSYLKGWGCEVLVKRDTPDKLQQRSVKYAEFFEKNLITQEVSGRAIDLEEIQDKDTSSSKITSEIPIEVEGFEPPQEEVIPVRRLKEHTSKLLIARLVAKGYTQLYEDDYEETFSPVADIRAIRILISIAAFYDYEIWQMDVKTAFLNGYLDEDIYMVQPEGFVDPNHPRKASGSNVTFLILYVDDIIIMENHIPSLQSVKDYLGKCFAIKDLGEAAFILGIKIDIYSLLHKLNYIAASETEMEAVWIRKFILRLGIVPTINEPIKMFCDNSAALLIANQPGVQMGAKHYHRSPPRSNLLKVQTLWDNLAYPFTKALPKGKLTQLARSLGLQGIILLILGGFAWCYTHAYIEDGVTFIAKSSVTFLAKSDSDVEVAYDETAQFMASGGANDLCLYEDEDYDIYDTYDIEGLTKQDLTFVI